VCSTRFAAGQLQLAQGAVFTKRLLLLHLFALVAQIQAFEISNTW
jgi:hypothetical protein